MPIKELIDVEKRQQNPESQNPDRINLFTFKFLERIIGSVNTNEGGKS